ncbi:MAG: helix-turn-helix domain-containing protein [Novosphingobium sp.]
MTQGESLERLMARVADRQSLPAFVALAHATSLGAGKTVPLPRAQTALVYISSGATKLVAHAAAEREQVTAFNFAGDLVSVPGEGPHRYTLHTLVASDLTILPYKELRDAIAKEPAILGRLLDNCDAALCRCREKALMIGRKTASERMAGFLVMMAARIGTPRGDTILLDLPMSRRDIGDSLGLTIETVSRQFSLLRDERQIATEGRSKVLLLDFPGLQARAGHLSELGPAFSTKFALDQC